MAMMPPQDPMAGPDAAPEAAPDGGYTVCLTVTPDGAMTVSVEPAAQEAAEASEPAGTPVKGLQEAMSMIMDIVKNNGEMQSNGDADFAAGFGGAEAPANPGQLA